MKKKTNLIRLILLLVIALVLVVYLAVPGVNTFVNQAMAVLGSANLDAVAAYIRSFGAYAGTADFAQDVPSFAQPAVDYSRPSMGVPTPAAAQQPQVYQQPVQQPQNTGNFGTQQFAQQPVQQPFQAAFQPQQPLMGGATGPMAPQQPVQQPQQDSRGVPVWMKKRNS